MSGAAPRFCTNCGARQAPRATTCPSCRRPLPKPANLARRWGTGPAATAPRVERAAEGTVIDLVRRDEPGTQSTTPFSQTRRFEPVPPQPADPPPTRDRGDSRSYQASRARQSGGHVTSPPPPPVQRVSRPPRGPGGCVLGILAFLLICVVAAVFGYVIGRPLLSHKVRDQLNQGVSAQVKDLGPLPVDSAGQLVVTEAEINQNLRAYEGTYDPVTHPVVTITPQEITVTFDLYGTTSAFHGGLAVQQGRLVVVNPRLNGPAGQFMEPGDVAQVVEQQLAAMMTKSNLQPTSVKLRAGSLSIATTPV